MIGFVINKEWKSFCIDIRRIVVVFKVYWSLTIRYVLLTEFLQILLRWLSKLPVNLFTGNFFFIMADICVQSEFLKISIVETA